MNQSSGTCADDDDLGPGAAPIVLPLRVYPDATHVNAKLAERIVLHDAQTGNTHEMVAASTCLLTTLRKAERIARRNIPVLIHGETGTGKELIARIVHERSPRRDQAFIQVNCAAFSDSLIESELFGHEKGAFTGADQRHAGYFERADQGSILLDEIGEMPLKLQAKLLRVLEEEAFERVGGEKLLSVDVRLIATTNRDLEVEIQHGRFRNDLYYRLNTMILHLPPLRERKLEIPELVHCFIRQFHDQGEVAIQAISASALECLIDYEWPGNIRQLRNVIHHACVVAVGPRLEVADLPTLTSALPSPLVDRSGKTLAELERQHILEVLREVGGNRTAAALKLGITTRTLQNKLKLYRVADAA